MTELGPDVTLNDPAFVHETALLYGKVTLDPGASLWPYAVLRAELHEIRIGARSNVQDHVMMHAGFGHPVIIGEDCSITHHVTLHGCRIGDRCLIGINATVMDGAVIGANSIVAEHAIVREGAVFPENAVIAGVPARLVTTRDNSAANLMNARFYLRNAQNYARGVHRMAPETLAEIIEGA